MYFEVIVLTNDTIYAINRNDHGEQFLQGFFHIQIFNEAARGVRNSNFNFTKECSLERSQSGSTVQSVLCHELRRLKYRKTLYER